MDQLIVGAVQLSSQADVDDNLRRATELVGEAARRGAKIVLLPENFAYLGEEEGKRAFAEELPLEKPPPGPIGARLAEVSRSHKIHLIAGGMPERSGDPDRPY